MSTYILRRVLLSIPTLLVISFVIFAVLSLAPGDPMAQFGANPAIPAEVRARIRESLGLDKPWPVRYVKWLVALGRGDWGFSFASRVPVMDLVKQRLPQTLWVVGISYFIAIIIAIPIGIISAIKQYSLFDQIATTLAFIGFSVPTFFIGLLFILLFSVKLHWLPFIYDTSVKVTDWASLGKQLKQMSMPIAVLTLSGSAAITRFMRSSMLDNLPQDYVRTARGRRVTSGRLYLRHALPNLMASTLTLTGLILAGLLGGAVIIETVFSLPGLGLEVVQAIIYRDYPVIQGIVLTIGTIAIAINLVIDVLLGLIDPRTLGGPSNG